jgi:hypothetical protein
MSHTVTRTLAGAFLAALLACLGCDSSQCDFVSRCEGNEYVTCNVQESIGPSSAPPYISRTRCEGENPVCLSDGTRSSGCFRSAEPVGECTRMCRGSVYVSCWTLTLGDAGPQTFERVTDCSRVLNSKRQPHVCSAEVGATSICLNPDHMTAPATP